MNRPSMENLLSTGSYQEELYASALGWKTPELFILNRAIVISVKVGVDVSPQGSANLPQFSINARIIGEDLSNVSPENEVTRWYAPLMSNTIISVPEVGEQVFVMRETTLNKSKGYWIARVNDTDTVSLHLTNDQNKSKNSTPLSRYGMKFDVNKLNVNSRQNSPRKSRKVFQLPLNLGDVLMQGRSGSYIRHSYLPLYSDNPGTLEMGILEDRVYDTSAVGTVGSTQTKTVHFSNAVPTDISSIFTKVPSEIDDSSVKRNFIANIAEETYLVSSTTDSDSQMHKMVLGERLNDYFTRQDNLIREFVNVTAQLLSTVKTLFDSYLNHEHTIPEINIDIPDKTIEIKDLYNRGIRREPQPNKKVFTPQQRFVVPGTGDIFDTTNDVYETITEVERPANGPPVVTTRRKLVKKGERKLIARGTPGTLIKLDSKVISIPQADKIVNLGYDVRKIKRTIKFDDINIGGSDNPRMTVPIATDSKTADIQDDLISLLDQFQLVNNKFIKLTRSLNIHLSKRHFVN